MADKFDSVQFTSVTIALTRCWQQVHTDSGQHMRFAGQFFYVPADFVIKKADALGSYPVEFNLVRGTPEQHHVEHGIGKFAYHDIAGGLINAWYCVSDTTFAELWQQFRIIGRDDVHVGLSIGPIERSLAEDIIWDRSKQKVLFIIKAEITFSKELGSGKGDASEMGSSAHAADI
jgi:hypothetical protein